MGERLHSVELSKELVQSYANTFIPRWDCYPLQRSDTGTYYQVKRPLTSSLVHAHLTCHWTEGNVVTLGAYALSPNNTASWLCYDADDETEWETLWKFAHRLREQDVPTYQEQSRRGGHLWLFTPEITGSNARIFGLHLLKEYGIDEKDIDHLYPRQAQLGEGAGSFVRLPLGVHQKTGSVYHFVDLNGNPLASTVTDQIRNLANPDRVPQAFIDEVLLRVKQAEGIEDEALKSSPVLPSLQTGETLSEAIKKTVSVHALVSQYVDLDRSSRGRCPFHDDNVKSFQVNTSKNYWSCYAGCGGGSVIDFWMKWRETHGQDGSFTATIKDLREILL
jgi:hypothetical protein